MAQWDPREGALHSEGVENAGDGVRGWMTRHPANPYVHDLDVDALKTDAEREAGVRGVARDYLRRIVECRDAFDSTATLPAWLADVIAGLTLEAGNFAAATQSPRLLWLTGADGDTRRSFWVKRMKGGKPQGPCLDASFVLFASAGAADGRSLGLRVVLHVAPPDRARQCRIRVTGVSAASIAVPIGAPVGHVGHVTAGGPKPATVDPNPPRRMALKFSARSGASTLFPWEPRRLEARKMADGRVALGNANVQVLRRKGRGEDDFEQALMPSGWGPNKPVSDIAGVAAANAFAHANDLFAVLRELDFLPEEYFRFAEPKVEVRIGARLPHGPARDGLSANAEVVWEDWKEREKWKTTEEALAGERQPGRLQVLFSGLAGSRSATGFSGRPRDLASDPCWNWHEFGHVLLAATTGEMELRFAHSFGDALAAIFSDLQFSEFPDEGLPEWEDRGRTFPWSRTPLRRHDRDVERGWGWSGAMFSRQRFFTDRGGDDKAEYWVEQILSSTLFRLFEALGGATSARLPERHGAARHTVTLILRGAALLGAARVVPALTPDQFVSALIDADVGMSSAPGIPDGGGPRAGGIAHKVIRWAFERQGLYAPPGGITYGAPPPVDLSIADRAGWTYAPRVLLGDEWHADDATLDVVRQAGGKKARVSFAVKNIGSRAANQVACRCHVAELPDIGSMAPDWKVAAWSCAHEMRRDKALPAGHTWQGDFVIDVLKPGRRYAVLLEASCPEDRSNIDEATGLPCAKGPAGMPVLVACDNNLGFRILDA